MNLNFRQNKNSFKKLESDICKFYSLCSYVNKCIQNNKCDSKVFFRKTVLVEDLGYKIKKELEKNPKIVFSKEKEIKTYTKLRDFFYYLGNVFLGFGGFLFLINSSFLSNIINFSLSALSFSFSIFSFLKAEYLKKKQEILATTPKKIMDYY